MPRKSKQVNPVVYRGGWFRMYSDIIESGKVRELNDRQFRFWIGTLAVANKFDGVLPSVADIAYRLRLSERDAAATLFDLITAKFIDQVVIDGETKLVPHDWSTWQSRRSSSTDRVRKFREKKRAHETHETRFNETVLKRETLSSLPSSHVSREEGAIHEKNDDGSGDASPPIQVHSLDGTLRNDPTEGTYGANVVPLTARRAS